MMSLFEKYKINKDKRIIFAFDFDGTITKIPGQRSKIFENGKNVCELDPRIIADQMKLLFDMYISKQAAVKIKRFFKEINDMKNCEITIQTNNYKNVVIGCLVEYLGIPLEWINLDESCFRKCENYKHINLERIIKDKTVGLVYYFEDSENEINKIKDRKKGKKIKVINCENGDKSLGKMLNIIDVTDEESLLVFLEAFSE